MFVGILLGGLAGAFFAWGQVRTAPSTTFAQLSEADKENAVLWIARAYQQTGDLPRTESRLRELGYTDLVSTVTAQAQRAAASGLAVADLRALVQLAEDLKHGQSSVTVVPSLPAPSATPPPLLNPVTPLEPTSQSRVETPNLTEFALLERTDLCSEQSSPALLQVYVRDAGGQPLRGVGITIRAAGVTDRFFTGLKPDVEIGYADYELQPTVLYVLEIGENASPVPNLLAPNCTSTAGEPFAGSIRLVFQKAME
jgi:hypothetical protein